MTDLPEFGAFGGLPIIIQRSPETGKPIEPKWHHLVLALLDLPSDERRSYVQQLIPVEDTDPRIPDVLDALSGHDSLSSSPQAVFRSVLKHTDAAPGGYVKRRDIVPDLERAGFQFKRFTTKTDQIISPAESVVSGNLVSERGIARGYRLINPTNARMFRNHTVLLPEEIQEAPSALRLAYRAFRLVVPNPDGSGIVKKSEVASALNANDGYTLPVLAREVVSKVGLVFGDDANTESIARVAIIRLAEHPLFETSSLRYGPDRWLRLKAGALRRTIN